MKNLVYLIGCIILSQAVSAQSPPCDEGSIQHQIDSLKEDLKEKGFTISKEAIVPMTSQFEIPIIVQFEKDTWYRFHFIGEPESRLYEVRMFDYSEKQVSYIKHQWGEVDGNIITLDYVPKFSEPHMIRSVQVNKKKKNLCGCFLLGNKTKN